MLGNLGAFVNGNAPGSVPTRRAVAAVKHSDTVATAHGH